MTDQRMSQTKEADGPMKYSIRCLRR